jgi:manganese efflux pump family protein
MSIAALITWIVAAGFGFFMLIRWATRGGVRKVDGAGTNLPAARVFTHFGLAAAGLILWIIYLVTDNTLLAWIAFVDLVLIALLGVLMVRQWAKDGHVAMAAAQSGAAGGTATGDAAAGTATAGVDLAEQHIPRAPVVLHGIFAVSTVILVLLAALGVGGS